jgi:DNA-binding NarL/FixJ family response regulator
MTQTWQEPWQEESHDRRSNIVYLPGRQIGPGSGPPGRNGDDDAGAGREPVTGAVLVRVESRDPRSARGVITQLRSRPEVAIAGAGARPSVLLAVTDSTDAGAVQWLRDLRRLSGLPTVLVTSGADPADLARLVEAGLAGVISRAEATAERLARAVSLAAAGRGDLPAALVRHLLDQACEPGPGRLTLCGGPHGGLTRRERDVLRLVADGLSTREVAAHLAYSERTIKGVVQGLVTRLNVRNRTHAVAIAVRNGWI